MFSFISSDYGLNGCRLSACVVCNICVFAIFDETEQLTKNCHVFVRSVRMRYS